MHLGFIGLGHLGKAMAGRLLERGHTLTVWNRSPEKAEGMAVEVAPSPGAVAKAAEVVFLCLFDSRAVHSVLTAPDGILAAGIAGKVVVDTTTNHFREVPVFHDPCEGAGGMYLEAPVLGSVAPASRGALTVLVSGNRGGYERIEAILQDIGKRIFYLGQPGLATKMKLVNNLTIGSFMATLAEALSLGEAVGIEKQLVLDVLSAGGGDSLVLTAKKDKLLKEDFATHFSSALIYKDLHCLQDLAYELRQTLFTGAVVKELYARTFAEGIDQEDFSAIYKMFKKPAR